MSNLGPHSTTQQPQATGGSWPICGSSAKIVPGGTHCSWWRFFSSDQTALPWKPFNRGVYHDFMCLSMFWITIVVHWHSWLCCELTCFFFREDVATLVDLISKLLHFGYLNTNSVLPNCWCFTLNTSHGSGWYLWPSLSEKPSPKSIAIKYSRWLGKL